jgi:hypothetical protein
MMGLDIELVYIENNGLTRYIKKNGEKMQDGEKVVQFLQKS